MRFYAVVVCLASVITMTVGYGLALNNRIQAWAVKWELILMDTELVIGWLVRGTIGLILFVTHFHLLHRYAGPKHSD